jgi:hypothetical protein
MHKPDLRTFPFLEKSKKEKPQLHTAQLLSPQEVEMAFKDDTEENRAQLRDHWLLTGAVHQEMYGALRTDEGREAGVGLATLSTPSGAAYAILCTQLHSRQHRHVLPLYEPRVAQFIESATREPFQMYIEGSGDDGTRMLYTCPLPGQYFLPIRTLCKTIDMAKRPDFIDELPALIERVTRLTVVKSLKSSPLTEVDVSIFLPQQSAASGIFEVDGHHVPGNYCH